jgi:CubicO group peptidase (beta-lactamase class C family)
MRPPHPLLAGLVLAAACGRTMPDPAPPAADRGWASVTALLDSAIQSGAAPGAVLGVSLRGMHRFAAAGRLGQDDATRPDSTTVYDLASLTKVIGLTTMVMIAVDEGRLAVDTPVVHYVPAFAGHDSVRRSITLRHLLTHSSGLPAWRPLYQETRTRDQAFQLADTTPLEQAPGTRYTYSDLGAMVLTQAVERAYHRRLDSLLATRVFGPLGMRDTRYLPPPAWRSRIAPTENDPWRGRVLRGEVHDENASRLDGVSGHAGLFSSARDLLRFADWLLGTAGMERTGQCHGSSAPPALAVPRSAAVFFARQDLPPGSTRALGWDTPSASGSSAGTILSRRSIGHTGFTGTSIWIDPTRCLAIVLLSNRVHPTRDNPRWGPVRGMVADRVAAALAPDSVTH